MKFMFRKSLFFTQVQEVRNCVSWCVMKLVTWLNDYIEITISFNKTVMQLITNNWIYLDFLRDLTVCYRMS